MNDCKAQRVNGHKNIPHSQTLYLNFQNVTRLYLDPRASTKRRFESDNEQFSILIQLTQEEAPL